MELSSIHGLCIEPGHLLVGVALCRVKPHLDAAATASAVVADFEGVIPDFVAQSSRRGEVEIKAVAGILHRALINPCGRMEALQPLDPKLCLVLPTSQLSLNIPISHPSLPS